MTTTTEASAPGAALHFEDLEVGMTWRSGGRGQCVSVNFGCLTPLDPALCSFNIARYFEKPDFVDTALTDLAAYVHDGRLRPTLGGRYAPDQAREMHGLIEARQPDAVTPGGHSATQARRRYCGSGRQRGDGLKNIISERRRA